METYKTTSRRALALIQIWASEQMLFFRTLYGLSLTAHAHIQALSENNVPTERAAWVFPSYIQSSTNVQNMQEREYRRIACGRGRFLPRV